MTAICPGAQTRLPRDTHRTVCAQRAGELGEGYWDALSEGILVHEEARGGQDQADQGFWYLS